MEIICKSLHMMINICYHLQKIYKEYSFAVICKFYCLFFAQDLQISSYKGHAQQSFHMNYKVYP